MRLALVTGIPPSVWLDEGQRAIDTALEMLEDSRPGTAPDVDGEGRQMRG